MKQSETGPKTGPKRAASVSDFLRLSDILWTLKLGTNQPKQPLEWTLQVPKFSPLNRLPGKLELHGSQVAAAGVDAPKNGYGSKMDG